MKRTLVVGGVVAGSVFVTWVVAAVGAIVALALAAANDREES